MEIRQLQSYLRQLADENADRALDAKTTDIDPGSSCDEALHFWVGVVPTTEGADITASRDLWGLGLSV